MAFFQCALDCSSFVEIIKKTHNRYIPSNGNDEVIQYTIIPDYYSNTFWCGWEKEEVVALEFL